MKYHTARFQLVPTLRSELHVATSAVRHPGSAWTALPAQKTAAPAVSQVDALEASGVHRLFQECISNRVRERPDMKAALAASRDYRSLGAKVSRPATAAAAGPEWSRDAGEFRRMPAQTVVDWSWCGMFQPSASLDG